MGSQPSRGAAVPSRPPIEGERVTEPWYQVAKVVLLPPLLGWFRLHHEHLDRIPARGPAIVACNHISYLDPLTNAEAVHRAGRRPRFLAKQDLFRIPVVGTVLRGTHQIPVARGTRDRSSLDRAAAALEHGEVIVVYPEGTVTKRPDGLPMEAKTGTVRLSLRTGIPITPMASWGSQAVWQKSGKGSLRFGRPILTTVGEPITAPSGDGTDDPGVKELTAELMAVLTTMVEDLRDRYPARWK